MNRIPAALFVVDIHREHIAIAEAKKLGVPTFAIVDTNSDPNLVDFCIPGNDDASRSIEKIVSLVTDAIHEGLSERNSEKEAAASAKAEAKAATAEKKVDEQAEKK
jgi:small subunit ribosomal protein S2